MNERSDNSGAPHELGAPHAGVSTRSMTVRATTTSSLPVTVVREPGERWLDGPLAWGWCVGGWLLATVLFYALSATLGGPVVGDSIESTYSTWAIAHGNFSCAFPPPSSYHVPGITGPLDVAAPLYSLLSGALAALLRIGHAVAFPSTRALGAQCATAFSAMNRWSLRANATHSTLQLGYLVWIPLLAGVVTLIRVSGHGRRRWEPLAVTVMAVSLPVYECLVPIFHPQDLLSMGLIAAGVACALQRRWTLAGVLLGLAFTSQQFSLLVAAPLVVVAPRDQRVRFAVGATVAVAVVALPLIVASSGRAARAVLLGSSRAGFIHSSAGGTVLWELHLHGVVLFAISRVAPIVAAGALAWWARRRLGDSVLEPVALVSLIATALCLRLVFEVNLFPYYFMAVSVMLIVLTLVQRCRLGPVVAWLSLATLAFYPLPWVLAYADQSKGLELYQALPYGVVVVMAIIALLGALRHRVRWYLFAWLIVVFLTCVPQIWGLTSMFRVIPYWAWQLILVPPALYLCVEPLVSRVRHRDDVDLSLLGARVA